MTRRGENPRTVGILLQWGGAVRVPPQLQASMVHMIWYRCFLQQPINGTSALFPVCAYWALQASVMILTASCLPPTPSSGPP